MATDRRDLSTPVVLVPGWLDNIDTLSNMATFLRNEGFDAHVCSPQPSNGTVPIEPLAQQLAAFVDQQFRAEEEIDYFGFSMGGLIGRVYLQQMEGWRRIRRFVTASSPHRGTFTAYAMPFKAAVQMRPNSQLLRQLNADFGYLARAQFVSIYTPLDLTIFPYTRSKLPVGTCRRVWTPFHAYVPFDRRVMALVAEILRSPAS